MNGELRALGIAHGLLMGLVLAAPLTGMDMMRWGMEALFIIGAFQLRLADRRFALRPGWQGWTSHIRMAPGRMIIWTALAVAALIARPDKADLSLAIAAAAGIGELLVYPVCVLLLPGWARSRLAALLAALTLACAAIDGEMARLLIGFGIGTVACLFWMRSPDGEARSFVAAIPVAAAALLAGALWPAALPMCVPVATVAATLALAHMSIWRRHPLHWRLCRGLGDNRRVRRLRSPLS